MEFTGFCYSNSRVSPWFGGNVYLGNGGVGWMVKGTQAFLGEVVILMPVMAPGPIRGSFNADRAAVNP